MSKAEEIAEIMLAALNREDRLWDALPEDAPEGNALIVAALGILIAHPERIAN